MTDPLVLLGLAQMIFLYCAIAMVIAAFSGPVTGLLADKIGRRPAVLITMVLFAIAVVLLGLFATTPALFFLILLLSLTLTACNAVLWIFVPESFPTRVRATGVGFAGSTGRVISFVSPMILGAIIGAAGDQAAFFTVAAVSAVGGLVVFLFSTETKGKSLEKIAAGKEE
ncbi:MAG: MFS transporter [Propionibacteriaceae bacterium]|jgi:MFS family permease|nr:MFS transporter [Propionibacteriaceae bacterium]